MATARFLDGPLLNQTKTVGKDRAEIRVALGKPAEWIFVMPDGRRVATEPDAVAPHGFDRGPYVIHKPGPFDDDGERYVFQIEAGGELLYTYAGEAT